MTNLSEFLLDRIAEDEEAAGRARVYGWPAVLGPDALASHIARWDPARVLAECKAKRRAVAMRLDELDRILAVPYATHPDYDEAWRP